MAHADDDAALRRLLCVDGQVQLQEPVTSTGGKRQEDWHGAKVKGGSVVSTSYGLLQLGGTSRYSNQCQQMQEQRYEISEDAF